MLGILTRRRVALAFCALAGANARADAPAFQLIRANEDWRGVADAPMWKNIPLSSDGESTVSLGGEWRLRLDTLDASRYGIGRVADTYALQRALVHADVRIGDHVRVFAQLGREDAIGKKPPLAVSDTDRGDVQNLFVDVNLDRTTLRAGRQELMFSPLQRFVSVREGPNVRQSFDGVRATWRGQGITVDAFATRPVVYKVGAFDDASDDTQAFSGVYASMKLGAASTLDAYVFNTQRDDVTFGNLRGDERRDSAGMRYAFAARGFDLDAEAIMQRGRQAGRDVRAWAGSIVAGYTLKSTWSPRFGLEVDAGSGDRTHDATLGTFNPLFPKGAYFDESGLVSWANLVLVRASVAVQPVKSVTLKASVATRRRQSADDAVYLQPYAPLPGTMANRSRNVGSIAAFDATWRVSRWWNLSAQIARHEAGAAVRQAGGRDVDFAMAMAQLRF